MIKYNGKPQIISTDPTALFQLLIPRPRGWGYQMVCTVWKQVARGYQTGEPQTGESQDQGIPRLCGIPRLGCSNTWRSPILPTLEGCPDQEIPRLSLLSWHGKAAGIWNCNRVGEDKVLSKLFEPMKWIYWRHHHCYDQVIQVLLA